MDSQEFAVRFGVTPDKFTQEAATSLIVRLFEILAGALETIRKARSGSSVGVKKAVELISADEAKKSAAAELADRVREIVFTAIHADPDLSVLLPEHFGIIVDEIRDVRALVLEGMDIEDAPEEDVSEELETARHAKDAIERFSTLLGMHGLSLSDLPASMLKTNKKKETVLSLPRVPSIGDSDEGATSTGGKPVNGAKFRFTLNGEPVNVSGFKRLATFHCSTPTYRMNMADLMSAIRQQTGKEWSDQDTFTVKVPAGTLTATLK